MSDSWPEADALAALFRRLGTGDRLAQSDFLAAVLDPLVSCLRRWRRDADEHACLTAAENTVLDLIHDPALYDPTKRSLIGFLCMSARADLLNELAKERKHHRGRENHDCVEVAEGSRNPSTDELADDLPSFSDPDIAAEIASFTPAERAVFDLMRAGERATAAFVPVLRIEHLSEDEQRREVKRAKDRIIKRLQRVRRRP